MFTYQQKNLSILVTKFTDTMSEHERHTANTKVHRTATPEPLELELVVRELVKTKSVKAEPVKVDMVTVEPLTVNDQVLGKLCSITSVWFECLFTSIR